MESHVPPPLPLKKRRLNFQWAVKFTRVYFHQCFKQESHLLAEPINQTRVCFPKRYRMPLASFSDVSFVVWIWAKRTVGNRFFLSCQSIRHQSLAFRSGLFSQRKCGKRNAWGVGRVDIDGVGSVFSMCNIQNSIDKLFKTSVPFFQIYSKLSFQMYSKF